MFSHYNKVGSYPCVCYNWDAIFGYKSYQGDTIFLGDPGTFCSAQLRFYWAWYS